MPEVLTCRVNYFSVLVEFSALTRLVLKNRGPTLNTASWSFIIRNTGLCDVPEIERRGTIAKWVATDNPQLKDECSARYAPPVAASFSVLNNGGAGTCAC